MCVWYVIKSGSADPPLNEEVSGWWWEQKFHITIYCNMRTCVPCYVSRYFELDIHTWNRSKDWSLPNIIVILHAWIFYQLPYNHVYKPSHTLKKKLNFATLPGTFIQGYTVLINKAYFKTPFEIILIKTTFCKCTKVNQQFQLNQ